MTGASTGGPALVVIGASLGGLAVTPTSLEIEKRLAGLKKGCGTCACH